MQFTLLSDVSLDRKKNVLAHVWNSLHIDCIHTHLYPENRYIKTVDIHDWSETIIIRLHIVLQIEQVQLNCTKCFSSPPCPTLSLFLFLLLYNILLCPLGIIRSSLTSQLSYLLRLHGIKLYFFIFIAYERAVKRIFTTDLILCTRQHLYTRSKWFMVCCTHSVISTEQIYRSQSDHIKIRIKRNINDS